MSEKQVQMTLDFKRQNRFSREHFIYGASNKVIFKWMKKKDWADGRLWVWGASGRGKSHLLHVWAEENHAFIGEASSLSQGSDGEIFFNEQPLHDPVGNIALDHIENLKDEIALLHLLNRSYGEKRKVFIAGRVPPTCFSVTLPDLASRLRATISVEIAELEDASRARLLLSLIAEKQLIISQPVIEFLWKHLPRTSEAMIKALTLLDREALIRGVPITRMLAQELLDL